MSKTSKIILISILLLGSVVRFWRLSNFPPLNADEAALGYNALSLIETGKDEHGNSWPIHFQSFNDYKPGMYVYLDIPFIKLFGLNEWSVRFPGALLGILTILIVYLLARELGGDKYGFSLLGYRFTASEFSALFVAISPWHIHFSRGAWEVNVSTFFMTCGLLFFLRAIKRPILKNFAIFSLCFVLSMYTYHAVRIIIPLLGLAVCVIYFKSLWNLKRQVVFTIIFGLLLIAPLLKDLAGPAGISRAAGVGIFSDPGPFNEINEQRGEHDSLSSIGAKVLHNKVINYSIAILENWGEHFSGEYLFLSGDEIQRNRVPEHGQMYMFEVVFVLMGIVFFVKNMDKSKAIVMIWLLISPIAASLTFQSPHALRSQNMVIPLVLLSAFGFVAINNYLSERLRRKYILLTAHSLLLLLLVWGFARYQQLYWVHMPKAYPFSSQYGFKEMINYAQGESDKFDTILITDRYDQPYILTLFYLKYPPDRFQSEHTLSARDGYGFSTVREFGNYKFYSIKWPETPNSVTNSLIIGTDEEIPDANNIIKRIYFPNGDTAYEVVAN